MTLSIWFFNVGYGDAIYAEAGLPDGRTFRMLMDGGSAHQAGVLHEFMAAREVRSLDLMVATHLHEDHMAGLGVVAPDLAAVGEFWSICGLPPGAADVFVDPGWAYFTRKTGESINVYRKLLQCELPRVGARVRTVTGGDLLGGLAREPAPGVRLEVLSTGGAATAAMAQLLERLYAEPEPGRVLANLEAIDQAANNACLVIRLSVGAASVLLPADASLGWSAAVPRASLRADLLKLAHHGNADATDRALLAAVKPKAAVVTAPLSRADRPEPQVLEALGRIPLHRSEAFPGGRWVQATWDERDRLAITSG